MLTHLGIPWSHEAKKGSENLQAVQSVGKARKALKEKEVSPEQAMTWSENPL